MDLKAVASRIMPVAPGDSPSPGTTSTVDSFGKSLLDAIEKLDGFQQQADARALELATGDSVELHDVMLAQEQASLTLELAVQVRNKLVEAYQDIMRMQI